MLNKSFSRWKLKLLSSFQEGEQRALVFSQIGPIWGSVVRGSEGVIFLKYHGNFGYNSAVERLNAKPKLLFRAAIYSKTERSQGAESLSIPSPGFTDPVHDPYAVLSAFRNGKGVLHNSKVSNCAFWPPWPSSLPPVDPHQVCCLLGILAQGFHRVQKALD